MAFFISTEKGAYRMEKDKKRFEVSYDKCMHKAKLKKPPFRFPLEFNEVKTLIVSKYGYKRFLPRTKPVCLKPLRGEIITYFFQKKQDDFFLSVYHKNKLFIQYKLVRLCPPIINRGGISIGKFECIMHKKRYNKFLLYSSVPLPKHKTIVVPKAGQTKIVYGVKHISLIPLKGQKISYSLIREDNQISLYVYKKDGKLYARYKFAKYSKPRKLKDYTCIGEFKLVEYTKKKKAFLTDANTALPEDKLITVPAAGEIIPAYKTRPLYLGPLKGKKVIKSFNRKYQDLFLFILDENRKFLRKYIYRHFKEPKKYGNRVDIGKFDFFENEDMYMSNDFLTDPSIPLPENKIIEVPLYPRFKVVSNVTPIYLREMIGKQIIYSFERRKNDIFLFVLKNDKKLCTKYKFVKFNKPLKYNSMEFIGKFDLIENERTYKKYNFLLDSSLPVPSEKTVKVPVYAIVKVVSKVKYISLDVLKGRNVKFSFERKGKEIFLMVYQAKKILYRKYRFVKFNEAHKDFAEYIGKFEIISN